MIAGPMAEALERGRGRYNGRFAAARKGGATVDGDSFLVHLGNAVAPVVEAVAAAMPERVDGVVNALFDVSLELFAASLLGPRSKSPAVGDVWTQLLPALTPLIMRNPKTVAAALSNAAYNLGRTRGARPGDWLAEMSRIGPACETVAELLDAGKVAAWRAGMPQYRKPAIATARNMRPALAAQLLEVPPDHVTQVLDRMLDDPWLTPRAALRNEPAAQRLVATVGAFRGFGGEFLRPPKVCSADGVLFVTSAGATWQLIYDCYGSLLLRHDRCPHPQPCPADVRVSEDGVVQFGAGRASLPELAGASGFACDGHTIAVTVRTSHHVFLVARAAAPEGAHA